MEVNNNSNSSSRISLVHKCLTLVNKHKFQTNSKYHSSITSSNCLQSMKRLSTNFSASRLKAKVLQMAKVSIRLDKVWKKKKI